MAAFTECNLTVEEYYSGSDHSDYGYSDNEDLLDLDAEMQRLQLSKKLEAHGEFGQVKSRLLAEACEAADAKRRQEELAARLPAEPEAKDKDAITLKLRFPDNTQVIRRFYLHQPLQLLVDFAGSRGYFDEKYRMFTSDFPRKNVATLDRNASFNDLKWFRREQVIVEEI